MAITAPLPAHTSRDRVGDAAAVRELQRRRLPVITALTALILLLHLLQWGMERAAQGVVEDVRTRWSALGREAEQVTAHLAEARRRHPERYLAGLSLDNVRPQLLQAEKSLERASSVRHPAEKARFRAEAETALGRVRQDVEAVRARLDRLDAAQRDHADAARRLEAAVQSARQTVASLESAGYRAEHFAAPRRLIAEAERRAAEVRALQERGRGRDLPYLEIYDQSQEGQARAEEAIRLARGVEELRRANEARIRDLGDRTARLRSQYNAARVAAARLVLYSAYASTLADVQRGRADLDAAADAAQEAARLNTMNRQEFREAGARLSEGERRAGRAADVFARAVETERLLLAALAVIAAVQASAADRIDDAERRIDRYDHIDQDRAERLLRDAAARFRRAQTVRHVDPIAAAELYRQARSLADEAYRGVDTTEPSSGGGGGWSSGGGSSGGGPSGGSSGGPSGGSFGGPSGGSFGGGGF